MSVVAKLQGFQLDPMTRSRSQSSVLGRTARVMELSATLGPGTLSAPHGGASVDGGIKES